MMNSDIKNIEFDLNDLKTPLPKIRRRSSIFEVPADEENLMETKSTKMFVIVFLNLYCRFTLFN